MKRVCMVTNIPTPYREPVHELINQKIHGYHVIYCQKREINREWNFSLGNYSRSFLKKRVITYKGRFIHMNPDIWAELNYLQPKIVITTGFNPTFLMAFFWCALNRKNHICMTDGWLKSEASLTLAHRLIRKLVFKYSVAFIGASKHSLDLYRFYKCREESLFQSHLCANNEYFAKFVHEKKKYDIMFSGQFIVRKMPLFFFQVAKKIKERKKSCSALILGSGPLKKDFLTCLSQFGIDYFYAGFVQQRDLPYYYSSSRIFLFPTLNDPWGVVVNEACAAAVPVITCENTGAAHDLIQHGENGFILPLDAHVWTDTILNLLNDDKMYAQFSKAALSSVQRFSYHAAAKGLIKALDYAIAHAKNRK